MGFEMLVEVAEVGECFPAILVRADVGSDLQVSHLVVGLERICLYVSFVASERGGRTALNLFPHPSSGHAKSFPASPLRIGLNLGDFPPSLNPAWDLLLFLFFLI